MKTRIIKVRRRRPSGVVWAISLMLLSLAFYLITSATQVKRAVTADEDDFTTTQALNQRVTKEITFPAVRDYLMQFGAFLDSENARIEASRYTNRGAAGYILYEDGMYRVIGSEYALREEAERVKEKLREQEAMDCQINAVGSEDVVLRVTATEAQIEALKNANDTLTEALDSMRALAYKLDGGEVTKEGALTELKACESRIAEAYQALKTQAGAEPNDVARDLLELMLSCDNTLTQLVQANPDNILSFSSKIKYNTIDMRIAQINFLKKLKS